MRRRSDLAGVSFTDSWYELKADYAAAKGGRMRRSPGGINPSGSSADWHIRSEAEFLRLREWVREKDRNDLVLGQGVNRVVDNVVVDGFTLDFHTGDAGLDTEFSARWREWSRSAKLCHSRGTRTWATLEWLIFRHILVDGDILVLPLRDGTIEPVEAHRLRSPRRTRRRIVHGVQLDEQDRPIAYWVTPGERSIWDTLKVGDLQEYPAVDDQGDPLALHVFDARRTSQTRGVSPLAPVLEATGMHDDLQFATLVAAQVQSCYAILREMADVPLGAGDDSHTGELREETLGDGSTRTIEGVAPGMEITGRQGEKLKGFQPTIPGGQYREHSLMILSFISLNLGLPVAVLLLDPTQTNFSGWRGSIDQARLGFRRAQGMLSAQLHYPVTRWQISRWLDEDPVAREAAKKSGVNPFLFTWHRPVPPYIEPAKDAAADRLRMTSLLLSPRRVHAERGRDWHQVADEIVADNAYAIRAAKRTAAELNSEFDADPIHWRELLDLTKSPPKPAGGGAPPGGASSGADASSSSSTPPKIEPPAPALETTYREAANG